MLRASRAHSPSGTPLARAVRSRRGVDARSSCMQSEPYFVIPTYRLRDVGETVRHYDEHFWRNGHSVRMMVFDDSSPAAQQKYYPLLEQTRTHNELYYVGAREKEQFQAYLNGRLRDKKLAALVKNLLRPSYGGNRNYTLLYTLGGLMVSSDDDMRPHALVEHSPESLGDDEVCRGRLHKIGDDGYARKSFDILAAFRDVVGKPVHEAPDNYERGELLMDTAMDLETNATKGVTRENSLMLQRGPLANDAIVKMAQTFRSGTSDIDAIDFVDLFLADDAQSSLDDLKDVYVLVNFRPALTNKNWRMDCGVAAYDNTYGLPPFFPTRLRFEDYIYRLWIHQKGVVAAHVDAAQHHTRSNYMRNRGRDLQRGSVESDQAQGERQRLSNPRARRHVRLRRLGHGPGCARDPRKGACPARAGASGDPPRQGSRGRGGSQGILGESQKGVLRIRSRLLPAQPRAHRGRGHQRHQGIHRALAYPRR